MDSLIALVIAASPSLFYIYLMFPKTEFWETFLFTFHSGYYNDVFTSAWVFFGKFTPMLLLFIWYFTCKYWWREAILIPIGMYLGQIIIYFNDEIKFKDELDWPFMIPIIIVVLVVLFLIRRTLSKYIELIDVRKEIQDQLNKIN